MNIKKATLLGMLLAFGLSICSTYAVTVRDNQKKFTSDEGVNVSFEWDGNYCITDGQPWGDADHPNAVYMDNNTGTLDVWCGRHDSSKVGDYFNSVSPKGSNTYGSISSMNFAIQGNLIINGDKYYVIIGQLNNVHNCWVIGGGAGYSSGGYSITTPDGKYLITAKSGDGDGDAFYFSINHYSSM